MADTKISALANEAAPTVGDERLVIATDLAGTPATKYIKIGDVMYSSDTAPTSPEAGFKWHETDTNIVWVYGTFAGASRWVSLNLYMMGVGTFDDTGYSAANYFTPMPQQAGYDLYLESHFVKYHVITTNNATHYWRFALSSVTGSNGLGISPTVINTLSTSAGSAGTWGEDSATLDIVIDGTGASFVMLYHSVAKVNAPGNISAYVGTVTCRLVHP